MTINCSATTCLNNSNRECTFLCVDIDENGRCRDYDQRGVHPDVEHLRRPITVTTRFTDNTYDINLGDQITVGHYTATAHKLNGNGTVLFIMDQYDDDPRSMYGGEVTGGYAESDLRKYLNSEEGLAVFSKWRERMVPFENGDLVRIPTVSEMFGAKKCEDWCGEDGEEQLPLMKLTQNRVAYRKNEWSWGWLQNKIIDTTAFAYVDDGGHADNASASNAFGVRRAFLIG